MGDGVSDLTSLTSVLFTFPEYQAAKSNNILQMINLSMRGMRNEAVYI